MELRKVSRLRHRVNLQAFPIQRWPGGWLKGKHAKQSNIKNKYTDVLERINRATYAEKIKHRNIFFLTLKPRDFRYGWKNPMSLKARKKISNFWQRRKLKFICGKQL